MNATLKTLIVDDEPLARELLASMLAAHPEVEVIGMAGSVAEARAFLERETPDVLFLDIEMPGARGLDLRGDLLPGTSTIFVTAFADYALEAFDFGARGYLLKPVDPSRLAPRTCAGALGSGAFGCGGRARRDCGRGRKNLLHSLEANPVDRGVPELHFSPASGSRPLGAGFADPLRVGPVAAHAKLRAPEPLAHRPPAADPDGALAISRRDLCGFYGLQAPPFAWPHRRPAFEDSPQRTLRGIGRPLFSQSGGFVRN